MLSHPSPINRLLLLLLFLAYHAQHYGVSAAAPRWTESDEARRIQQIKDEDEAAFRSQQHRHAPAPTRRLGGGGGGADAQPAVPKQEQHEEKTVRAVERTVQDEQQRSGSTSSAAWCVSCSSPLSVLSPAMQTTLQQLMKVRRMSVLPPAHAQCATDDAWLGRKVVNATKGRCLHSSCQTLRLVDPNTGGWMVLRGCAESFGAVQTANGNGGGSGGGGGSSIAPECTALHEKIDAQECICDARLFDGLCPLHEQTPRASATRRILVLALPLLFMLLFFLLCHLMCTRLGGSRHHYETVDVKPAVEQEQPPPPQSQPLPSLLLDSGLSRPLSASGSSPRAS